MSNSTSGKKTMSDAEIAANTTLLSALAAASTFLEGKDALTLLTTPGLLSEDLIKKEFVALEAQQESVPGAEEDGEAAAKPKPKLLGSVPPSLQALFASACHLASLTNTAGEACLCLGREYARRQAHALIDNSVDGGDGGDGAKHTDEDPGRKAVAEGSEAIGRLRADAKVRFSVFWDLVGALYPDAGKISVTSARTLVETGPKPKAGSMPPAIAALLASGLAGVIEVRFSDDTDTDADAPTGNILSSLFGGLLGRLGRRTSAGPN